MNHKDINKRRKGAPEINVEHSKALLPWQLLRSLYHTIVSCGDEAAKALKSVLNSFRFEYILGSSMPLPP